VWISGWERVDHLWVDQLGDEVISFPSKKSTVPASYSSESNAEARLDDSRLTPVRIGRQVTLS